MRKYPWFSCTRSLKLLLQVVLLHVTTISSANERGSSTLLHSPSFDYYYDVETENEERHFRRVLKQLTPSDPAYYDNLRTLKGQTVVSGVNNEGVNASNVYLIFVNETKEEVLMADIKSFLPFSFNATTANPVLINDGFCALLAIDHFNNVEKSPILTSQDLAGCQTLKLTMELFDTYLSPILTTRTFTSVLQRPVSLAVPPPAGVIGAFRSAVTSPLAILTGVNGIPQISAASTSVNFDVKSQFPLFGRTCTNSVGEATVAVRYFQQIGSGEVAILFITDSYGSALQKAFQDAANAANISTLSVPLSFSISQKEATQVVQSLISTQYRHVYAILYENQYDIIMGTAIDMGAAGADYFYLFPGLDIFNMVTPPPAGTSVARSYAGIGIIQMQGGVTFDGIVVGETVNLGPSLDPESGFDKFRKSWKEALGDEVFVAYVRTKLPSTYENDPNYDYNTSFAVDPGAFRPFLYDAVTAIGLSMCRASQNTTFFRGDEVYTYFLQTPFQGASGDVIVDNITGTRDYETISFVIWNSRVSDNGTNGNARVELVPAFHYSQGSWEQIATNEFIYSDGSTVPPSSLPPVEFDYNYIGNAGRIAGYTLMGITICCSVLSLLWLLVYRKEHVVSSAQPLFLFMVSFGTIVMSSTIVPLSLEEPLTKSQLDKACMSVPWLYVTGSTIALSGLLAKTRGVVQAYLNPELDFIRVSFSDILLFCMMYMLPNIIVLSIWTALAPLQWNRVPTGATDIYGRATASYAQCDSARSVGFVITVCAVNFVALLLGNWWAYRARNIETEYGESSYIGVSMAAVLQAWTMGIPILIVVWNSPPAKFYVSSGIIFVTSQAILCLVYIPKIIVSYQALKDARNTKKQAYTKFLKQRFQGSNFEDDRDNDDGSHNNKGDDGNSLTPSGWIDEGENPQDPAMEQESTLPVATEQTLTISHEEEGHGERVESNVRGVGNEREEMAFARDEGRHFNESFRLHRPGSIVLDVGGGSGRSKSGRFISSFIKGGATRSSKEFQDNNVGGIIKIVHHPRACSNLAVSGGVEMSRKQLDYLRDLEERETRKTKDECKEGESDLPDQPSFSSALDFVAEEDNERHLVVEKEERERGTPETFDA